MTHPTTATATFEATTAMMGRGLWADLLHHDWEHNAPEALANMADLDHEIDVRVPAFAGRIIAYCMTHGIAIPNTVEGIEDAGLAAQIDVTLELTRP